MEIMETKYGFTKMNLAEFENWIANLRVGRTVMKIQQHHTFIPSYIHFTGMNHFDRQLAMKKYHVNENGWADIGQHFTIFPDGAIVTGRSMESSPACIRGQNADSICVENFGNFDVGGDTMTAIQKSAIIGFTAALCSKFNLPVNSQSIVYHHWFRLDNGFRNGGSGNNKSCPGTNFFGGNKVADFERDFAPLVKARIGGGQIKTNSDAVLNYVSVTADELNVRTAPKATAEKVKERESVKMGAILRVYDKQDNWLKISNSQQNWVNGSYTIPVSRATVIAKSLNVRTGPGQLYPKNSSVAEGQEVFIYEEQNGWCKIGSDEKWVSKKYLKVD